MIVWLVFYGNWEATLKGVFSTENEAKLYVEKHEGEKGIWSEHYWIEEWAVDKN